MVEMLSVCVQRSDVGGGSIGAFITRIVSESLLFSVVKSVWVLDRPLRLHGSESDLEEEEEQFQVKGNVIS